MKKAQEAVIVMLNSKYIHSSLAPWYLLAGIRAFGKTDVHGEVVEGTVNMPLQEVAVRISEKKPDVIGFCCYIWNITFIKNLLPIVKEALPNAIIILGGPEVSYNADVILEKEPLVDYVLSGEGELPFAQLLDAIVAGEAVSAIPGVCFRADGKSVVSQPYCPMTEPPDPYTDDYFAALNGRIAYLETSRGCPFSCAFCLSGRTGTVRFFQLERAKQDLVRLANSGTKTVKLVDRTFNANRKRAFEIFKFIIESYGDAIPAGICFHFEIAGDLLDEETLTLLGTAPPGALQFEIGLQSFNPVTLAAIHRKTDLERLKRNIERLVSYGNSHIHIDLIAGLPYENLDSFEESVNTACALEPHMLQLGFLKLFHGAPLREREAGFTCRYLTDPPYTVLETPWLSEKELDSLYHTEEALDRLYNSGRFKRTLDYVFNVTGLTPFRLFTAAGRFMADHMPKAPALDHFSQMICQIFEELPGVGGEELRDRLICDRLATNPSRLPEFLKAEDVRLKPLVVELNGVVGRPKKGIRRGFAWLSSEKALVYVDYENKNPVTGEYALKRFLPEK